MTSFSCVGRRVTVPSGSKCVLVARLPVQQAYLLVLPVGTRRGTSMLCVRGRPSAEIVGVYCGAGTEELRRAEIKAFRRVRREVLVQRRCLKAARGAPHGSNHAYDLRRLQFQFHGILDLDAMHPGIWNGAFANQEPTLTAAKYWWQEGEDGL
ncbi:unnamed protein product [Amoebophrya sp. A120]|nr:unnamed protein product [Amoebophrya sp. A120]|eukprot:GSA120T00001640001.1